ncbi:MAG: peptide chain release factor N(5)-glutamine methyltransferase, partial [Acidobacteria bacterium]|nr:peptide chain release factor N(5)-glutamine methyltransferase [Acidobacteriota bacterium]
MLVGQALKAGITQLASQGVPSPRMNAELLLMFTLGWGRAHLYGHPEQALTPEQQSAYEQALGQRASGIPAQYITGHQEFWGMDLIVSPAVLIPRPETEHVVETALEIYRRRNTRRERTTGTNRMVDVGTGSGAIAMALAREMPDAELHATEISPAALEIARANAARHQLESRIHFHQTDLLSTLKDQTFDLVVSNPPYVGEAEQDQVQLEVRRFEPRNAVFAGPTGLEVIERLIPQAREVLAPDGWLILEVSGTIVERVQALLDDWRQVQ